MMTRMSPTLLQGKTPIEQPSCSSANAASDGGCAADEDPGLEI